MRVAAGAIARKILPKVEIKGALVQLGEHKINRENWDDSFIEKNAFWSPDPTTIKIWEKYIEDLIKDGDSCGAIIEIIAKNVPIGLGAPVYGKLDAEIANGIMSINAVKGVEIGNGFENTERWGREVQDVIEPNSSDIRNFSQISNNSGGIEGGMSNGNDIIINVAIKPIATMTSPLPSVDIMTGEVVEAAYNRSDICQVSRACPVGEAMLALTLTESVLEKFGGDSLQEIKRNYMSYIKTFKEYGK